MTPLMRTPREQSDSPQDLDGALPRAPEPVLGTTSRTAAVPRQYTEQKRTVRHTAGRACLLIGRDGVDVTVVAPDVVDTPFWDRRGGTPDAAPSMTPEQIADTVVFAVNQPAGVDINQITLRPTGQAG